MRVVRGNLVFLTVALLVSSILAISYSQSASAAQITPRTLTLQAGATDGGSKPSGVVRHQFTFTVPTTNNVGSIKFEYCTAAAGTCTLPTGLLTTSATLGQEVGATGFTMVNTTNGSPYLTRTASSITGATALTYRFDTVTNPSTTNTSFYVRISTFASTDTTGSPVDTGVVAASTATQIVLTGVMPESLIFCTGATVAVNCTTSTAGDISFNQLFSPTDTATATSQMAASTNAATGYSITVNGPTLTSGANTIPGMATQAAPSVGTSQFGMNLRANTVAVAASFPGVTANITPSSNGSTLKGQAFTGYNIADQFKYVSGDVVANSSSSGSAPPTVDAVPGPTNSQVYTAAYIVNVSGIQLAGTYVSTLTYICTATF